MIIRKAHELGSHRIVRTKERHMCYIQQACEIIYRTVYEIKVRSITLPVRWSSHKLFRSRLGTCLVPQ